METRDIFRNISPIDHRYSVSERAVFDALTPWLSEEASIAACVRAEIALIVAHIAIRKTEGAVENPRRAASASASASAVSVATPPVTSPAPELRAVLNKAGESVAPA